MNFSKVAIDSRFWKYLAKGSKHKLYLSQDLRMHLIYQVPMKMSGSELLSRNFVHQLDSFQIKNVVSFTLHNYMAYPTLLKTQYIWNWTPLSN